MSNTHSNDKQTEALAAVYKAVAAATAKKPKTVRERSPEDRAAYMREAKRRQRERARAAKQAGRPEALDEAIRTALADAAILLLATGGPGADALQRAVSLAFPGRPAVASTVRARCRVGTLRPRVLTVESLSTKG
ncbi:hypothetical protein Sa4125_29700 [Aureimonas sp. SA4125]|uniref:hypothetical protein n=1 Tax=Aureimonas sp. SA4125 TaxID=2826993 RepID=UPI001CC37A7B|nr:hypothetical protein [Aureimonas sp. SA4125]BDA85428.1 hypothetical protein Sa4125_29700 [Aureimonas sp. SA4125]